MRRFAAPLSWNIRRFVVPVIVIATICGVAAVPASAAPGDPDTTFGTNGTVLTSFANVAEAGSVLIQPADGKIVASGFTTGTFPNPDDAAIARYNTDGTLDSGFGTGGKLIVPGFGAQDDQTVARMAVQSDGKLLLPACVKDPALLVGEDLVARRLLANGSTDTSYGTNGTATAGAVFRLASGDYCTVADSAIEPGDGKLLVLWRPVPETQNLYVTRFDTDGTPDSGFGSSGTAHATFVDSQGTPMAAYPNDMKIQSDGKIVVVAGRSSVELARFNTDGTLDSGFGSGGEVIHTSANSIFFSGESLGLVGGQIIVGGGIWNPSRGGGVNDCALWRYNSNGTIDATFGTGGLAQNPGPGSASCDVNSMAIQSDGKIVGSGSQLARFNADGSLDTSFGSSGFAFLTGIGGDRINQIALQSDGKIVGAGWRPGGTTATFVVYRWLSGASGGSKANQTITVTTHAPSSAVYSSSFSVAASAPGGAVTFSSAGVCSNSGSTFTMTSGTGTCKVKYDQAGSSTYNPAPEVIESVTAQKKGQTISFAALADKRAGDPDFAVSASASSGLAVTFAAAGSCTVSGTTVHLTGLGTCSITGSQAGNANYSAATAVARTFTVANPSQAAPGTSGSGIVSSPAATKYTVKELTSVDVLGLSKQVKGVLQPPTAAKLGFQAYEEVVPQSCIGLFGFNFYCWEDVDHPLAYGSGAVNGTQGGDVIAVGAGHAVNVGAGHVIAVGSGNVIAVGAGHVKAPASGGWELTQSGQVICVGSGNQSGPGTGGVIAVGAGHVVNVGAGTVITVGSGNVIAVGAGHVVPINEYLTQNQLTQLTALPAGKLSQILTTSVASRSTAAFDGYIGHGIAAVHKATAKTKTLATAHAKFTSAGTQRVVLKFTAAGKRLIAKLAKQNGARAKAHKRLLKLKLTIKEQFKPKGGKVAAAKHTFTVAPRRP